MTKKRFNHHIDEVGVYYYVYDNTKKGDDRIILEFDSKFDAMEVCELLNELDEDFDDALNTISKIQEENQQLQEEIKDYNDVLARLEEQNEQLKKENKRLDELWGEKCTQEHMQFLGETALKEMHDEKYSDDRMTAKRFTYISPHDIDDDFCQVGRYMDNGKTMYFDDILNTLNNLHEENKFLKNKIKTYKTGNALLKHTLDEVKND